MISLSEVSRITGVTRRTLQEYEKVGLVKPTVQENGYWMYTGDDVTTITIIQLLRMADYKRSEIKEILQNGTFDQALSSAKSRLEERRKRIDGMIKMVDMMQRITGPEYDPQLLASITNYSIINKLSSGDTLNQVYERAVDFCSSTDSNSLVLGINGLFRISAVAAAKELPIESPIVQERLADLCPIVNEAFIVGIKETLVNGELDPEDDVNEYESLLMYLEEGGNIFAILDDGEVDAVEEIILNAIQQNEEQYYYRDIEKIFGEGSMEFVIKALIHYSREHYPSKEAKEAFAEIMANNSTSMQTQVGGQEPRKS